MKAMIWLVSNCRPSRKSRCSQYTHRTCLQLNSSSFLQKLNHHLAFSNLSESKSSDPAAQGSPGVISHATLPHAINSVRTCNRPSHIYVSSFLQPLPSCNLLSSRLDFSGFLKNFFYLSAFLSPSLSIPFSPPHSHQNGPQSKCDCTTFLVKTPHSSVYIV